MAERKMLLRPVLKKYGIQMMEKGLDLTHDLRVRDVAIAIGQYLCKILKIWAILPVF